MEQWTVLAKNKYGATVAACIAPKEGSQAGWIFMLPIIRDVAGFLKSFLKDVLPELSPALFPYAEGMKWVHRPEYELPSMITLNRKIVDIQTDAARGISELEKEIEYERNQSQFLYDLLRGTGRPLVLSVQKALSTLGFEAIIDVDAEMQKAGN